MRAMLFVLAAILLASAPAGAQGDAGAFTAPRMALVDVPVVDVRASDWHARTFNAGYGTVARFVMDNGAPPPHGEVLGAHNTGVFLRLPMLVEGDMVTVVLNGEVRTYEVVHAALVEYNDPALFNYPGLVLLTCTSYSDRHVWAVFAQEAK